jgi:hypothetical protein
MIGWRSIRLRPPSPRPMSATRALLGVFGEIEIDRSQNGRVFCDHTVALRDPCLRRNECVYKASMIIVWREQLGPCGCPSGHDRSEA